jgi:hypothetical protein
MHQRHAEEAAAEWDTGGTRTTVLRGDLTELHELELPRLPYGAAFSVQTMHHL